MLFRIIFSAWFSAFIGLGISEVAEIEVQIFRFAQKFNRRA
ncbi:MAG TPA: hypothetical protein PLJ42_03005 [Chitinophagales bacterium]|nr:hypothetical protein [Chitinophagales bacterium]HQW78378.1 hypothetical protein [Chitinophagales bacterium]HRB66786.1 hypothetical protein [Chitinophagales bacterium]HRB92247.1 hypothetical protein [Chitinophagales bacterium]